MNEAATYSQTELTRRWVESDTLNFTRYFFRYTSGGKKFVVGKHHRLICDKLNDVLQGRVRKLIINIAPRYGRTEWPSRISSQWGWA